MIRRAFPFTRTFFRGVNKKFCAPAPSMVMNQLKEANVFSEQSLNFAGNKVEVKFNDHATCYEIPSYIGGTTHHTSGQYMAMFTCTKCDTKQSKFFTKNAYHNGVVMIRCEGCTSVHLMADNLGWFGDDKINIETIMQQKGESVVLGNADPALLQLLGEKIKLNQQKFDELQAERQAQAQKDEELQTEKKEQ